MPSPNYWCKRRRAILKHFEIMELSYSELNEIYLVAQVNEADFSADYKTAIAEAKKTKVYNDKELAQATSVLLNRHKKEAGFEWILCKAHVRTESKLHFDNAEII
jgi:hypothetical protein